MTIEELLELAQGTCRLMDMEMGRDRGTLEKAAQYAAIAQAAALTAQAMTLAQFVTLTGADNAETFRPALRVYGDFR